jgi:hypothetical protein
MNDAGATGDLVDKILAEALAPVLRDLESSGSVIPGIRDKQWSTFEGQLTAMRDRGAALVKGGARSCARR